MIFMRLIDPLRLHHRGFIRGWGHCLAEAPLVWVCEPDDKLGRFVVAMPVLGRGYRRRRAGVPNRHRPFALGVELAMSLLSTWECLG